MSLDTDEEGGVDWELSSEQVAVDELINSLLPVAGTRFRLHGNDGVDQVRNDGFVIQVQSAPGSGKTSLISKVLEKLPPTMKRYCVVAFNVAIVEEFITKFGGLGPGYADSIDVMTIHSMANLIYRGCVDNKFKKVLGNEEFKTKLKSHSLFDELHMRVRRRAGTVSDDPWGINERLRTSAVSTLDALQTYIDETFPNGDAELNRFKGDFLVQVFELYQRYANSDHIHQPTFDENENKLPSTVYNYFKKNHRGLDMQQINWHDWVMELYAFITDVNDVRKSRSTHALDLTHDTYLKAVSNLCQDDLQTNVGEYIQKNMNYQVIFVDESQDVANCVHPILARIRREVGSMLAFFGDRYQAIYSFKTNMYQNILGPVPNNIESFGLSDAFQKHNPVTHLRYLGSSFRFSESVTPYANALLIAMNMKHLRLSQTSEECLGGQITSALNTSPEQTTVHQPGPILTLALPGETVLLVRKRDDMAPACAAALLRTIDAEFSVRFSLPRWARNRLRVILLTGLCLIEIYLEQLAANGHRASMQSSSNIRYTPNYCTLHGAPTQIANLNSRDKWVTFASQNIAGTGQFLTSVLEMIETCPNWQEKLETYRAKLVACYHENQNAVEIQCITIHASKGLQYENVIVDNNVQPLDRSIPDRQWISEITMNELFVQFVALTRPKRHLYISYFAANMMRIMQQNLDDTMLCFAQSTAAIDDDDEPMDNTQDLLEDNDESGPQTSAKQSKTPDMSTRKAAAPLAPKMTPTTISSNSLSEHPTSRKRLFEHDDATKSANKQQQLGQI